MPLLRMTGKQIKLMCRNRAALLALIAAPLLLAYLFSYSVLEPKTPLYAADLDGSVLSRSLLANLGTDKTVKVVSATEQLILSRIADGELAAGLVIDPGYGAALRRDDTGQTAASKPPLRLLVGQADSSIAVLEAALAKAVAAPAAGTPVASDSGQDSASAAAAAGSLALPHLNGFMAMFLWAAAFQAFRSLINERENHTAERLLASPLPYWQHLLTKIAAALGFGLLMIGLVWGGGRGLLHIHVGGDAAAELPLWAAYWWALSGISLGLALLARSHRSFTVLGSVVTALAGVLGGAFFSIDEASAPRWIYLLSRLVPGTWLTRSLSAISSSKTASLRSELLTVSLLAGIGTLCMIAALLMTSHNRRLRFRAQERSLS
ncbi:MAG: YfiN1 [Paenibacillaceae bacterium]|jgi:ABC-2 type transport system permease protein|nr:YfiN1 [Paenibacillaceae bacterium]